MELTTPNPLVSIITLCYNQAEIVERAIKSVVEQTYPYIQLVIVDDCSSDNSKSVIQAWQSKYPDKIKAHFNEANQGHPKSMNIGFSLCDGELVSFCDGDDWYFPEKVEREVALLRSRPDIDVVHSNFDIYTVDGTFIKHWSTNESSIPSGDIFLPLLSLQYPYASHLRYELTSKKILDSLGYYYDPEIPIWVDWDLRLRLAARYKFGYCSYVGSAYTVNPNGLTNVLKQEVILKNLKHVVAKNSPYLSNYSQKESRKALRTIQKHIQKLELAINIHKGQAAFWPALQYLLSYPSEVVDVRFNLSAMFGKKVVQSLARVKQAIKKR
jgi:glycosyltransferase involved in cell wall biosynthesis